MTHTPIAPHCSTSSSTGARRILASSILLIACLISHSTASAQLTITKTIKDSVGIIQKMIFTTDGTPGDAKQTIVVDGENASITVGSSSKEPQIKLTHGSSTTTLTKDSANNIFSLFQESDKRLLGIDKDGNTIIGVHGESATAAGKLHIKNTTSTPTLYLEGQNNKSIIQTPSTSDTIIRTQYVGINTLAGNKPQFTLDVAGTSRTTRSLVNSDNTSKIQYTSLRYDNSTIPATVTPENKEATFEVVVGDPGGSDDTDGQVYIDDTLVVKGEFAFFKGKCKNDHATESTPAGTSGRPIQKDEYIKGITPDGYYICDVARYTSGPTTP